MRSARVLRNVITNQLRFFLGAVISFVLTPIMLDRLGYGGYGVWVTVFSITGYFGLVDQGIRPSLVRYVSRDKAAGDDQGLARTINSAIALYLVAGLVTMVAALVIASQFGRWFHVDPHLAPVARKTVLVAGASLAIGFPLGVFGATLSGLQRYDIANAVGMTIAVLRALTFVLVLKLGGGILELAWVSLGANVLGHVATITAMRRLLPRIPVGLGWVDRATLRRIGAYSGFAFVGAIATSITFQTDSVVIAAFLNVALVTPFALAAGLVDNVRTLVYNATWVLAPTASEMDTLGETEKLHAMLIAGARYAVLLSWPVLAALIVYGGDFIVTWTHKENLRSAATLLTILCVPTFLSLPQSAASSMLYGVSRHKGVVTLSLLNALLNLGLSLLWVRSFQLVGVAFGTAVPLALIGGVATAVYAARAMRLPLWRYAREGVIQPGLVCLAFVAPALAIHWIWHPIGYLPLALAIGSSWLAFAMVAWRWGFAPGEKRRWARAIPGAFGLSRPAVGAATEAGS